MQTVASADGTRIAYERRGDGPPLVLLHGGSSSSYWDPVVPRFADDYTVVVPDRRGRGNSDHPDDPAAYGLDREVDDVHAVVEAVDGDPVLFGHSFGGLQAIEAARDAPVEAVVAYEPAVIVGEYRERADLADRMRARLDEGERREAMKLHLGEVIHGGEMDDLDAWLAEWPAWPDCVERVEKALYMNRAVEEYRLPDELDVDAPALLLTGSEGPSHLRDSVRAVREALPDSRLVEFDGVSHIGPVEAPDRVVPEVQSFLREAAAEPRPPSE
ncbi:alpha/beta hydrolase [Halostella sp. JP-L12]|uniref:alpha/beta fold hydrolase n=1 Tax=Halostella TaxID=1843185 RepID=UPI000EF7C6C4|nr:MULTISPECIES: alpha/beta hydrolase [Halostella]NHN46637.1 alpha/beta hydrolase [Halostella sp. JP-L12]